MSYKTSIFAVLAALVVVGMAASTPALASDGSGSLSVGVSQNDAGEVVVSVTHNGSGVADADVTVEAINNTTYAASGTYENATDENGTLVLAAPAESAELEVTASAGNLSGSTTATVGPTASEENETNGTDAFGNQVSAFVHELQSGNNSTDAPFGALVASFVVANNPGNAPDHAGPPEWLFNDSVEKGQGPPDHAGPPDEKGNGNNGGGPPDDRGNNGGGPPDHAGPPDDGDDEDDEK